MDENIKTAVLGLGMGILGGGIWYAEMFTDSKAANLWRRMNGKGRIGRNLAAIGAPSFACIFFLTGVYELMKSYNLPTIWLTCLVIGMLVFLSFFLIGLLPIRFPRWVYADWQYAKRHGLLDEKGNIDREAWERHEAEKKDDPIW